MSPPGGKIHPDSQTPEHFQPGVILLAGWRAKTMDSSGSSAEKNKIVRTEDISALTQANKEGEAHTVKSGKHPFYRTEIKIIILTEGPYDPVSLDQIAYDAAHGECSMVFTVEKSEKIDGPTMARLCLEQYSDPALFDLSDQGEDLDDAGEDEDEHSLLHEYRIGRVRSLKQGPPE